MFIATYNAIYALEDNGHSEPIQVYKGTDHQCLDGNAMVALPESQTVAVALSDGTLLLLSDGHTKRIPTGIKDPIASLLLIRENPLTLLIGTDEGAYVYRLVGEKGPAERIVAFDELSCREEWYTPWGGPTSRADACQNPRRLLLRRYSCRKYHAFPMMKGFPGNLSRQNFIKMSIRSLRVL